MKRLNVSILAVVAILAIGLTAFTKADTKSRLITVPNCYQAYTPQFTSDCTPLTTPINTGSSCASPQLNSKVIAASSYQITFDCDQVSTFFCCAQLVVDPNPCPTQTRVPSFTDAVGILRINQFAKISTIACKSL